MVKTHPRCGMVVLLPLMSILLAGCSEGDSIRAEIESAKLELSNLKETTFRQQQADMESCRVSAWFAGYKEDSNKLADLAAKQLNLRICSVEELQAIECEESFRPFPSGADNATIREYAKEFTEYCGVHIKEAQLASLSCIEKGIAYMEKYLTPLNDKKREEFDNQLGYSNKSRSDFAKEQYAAHCGYLPTN